ncbi:MAG: AraC family transcriptional regulator [Eubacteriales bacterium]|nr:AraC family transcriptional regulator [Eubacteriales bacterium]
MELTAFREAVPHGTLQFPVDVKINLCPAAQKGMMYCHWHDEVEFLHILRGRGNVRIGDRWEALEEGEVAFVPANQLHFGTADPDMGCDYAAVLADPRFLCGAPGSIVGSKYILPLCQGALDTPLYWHHAQPGTAALAEYLSKAEQAYLTAQRGYELEVQCLLLQVLGLLLRGSGGEPAAPRAKNADRIRPALALIDTAYAADLSLDELAASCGVSQGQFCRLFKAVMGISPFTYLTEYRIGKSAALLRDTDKRVLDIAYEVGFHQVSYFTACFRRLMRCTPREYRKG